MDLVLKVDKKDNNQLIIHATCNKDEWDKVDAKWKAMKARTTNDKIQRRKDLLLLEHACICAYAKMPDAEADELKTLDAFFREKENLYQLLCRFQKSSRSVYKPFKAFSD